MPVGLHALSRARDHDRRIFRMSRTDSRFPVGQATFQKASALISPRKADPLGLPGPFDPAKTTRFWQDREVDFRIAGAVDTHRFGLPRPVSPNFNLGVKPIGDNNVNIPSRKPPGPKETVTRNIYLLPAWPDHADRTLRSRISPSRKSTILPASAADATRRPASRFRF
jgi:hypothetical protein